jgi:hypothetical protein
MGVIMNYKLIYFVLLLFVQLSGCTTYYQYRSNGELPAQNGLEHKAVLYWYGEEGRLWYGKEYGQTDSGLNLRICQIGVKPFDLSDTARLELPARANDMRVVDVDAQGALQPVIPSLRLKAGDYCGMILLDGKSVTTDQLKASLQPMVAILCESTRAPDRYPPPQIYPFGVITRSEVQKDNRSPPDPCLIP